MIVKKKYLYIMFISIITLLGIVIVPTYAKFTRGYISGDVVGIALNYNLNITNIDEYHELVIPAGEMIKFNVEITNDSTNTAYYGIWYRMVSPNKLPSDGSIGIGKLKETTTLPSGSITSGSSITSSLGIVNGTNNEIKIQIGVSSSTTSVNDIEYLNGKNLISGEVNEPMDIMITSVIIDGTKTNTLPTSGTYTMEYSCTKGSTLTWNTYTKTITYGKNASAGDRCALTFTSSTNYPLLNKMNVGDYVAYTGKGGTVGSTQVSCSGDACKGANANQASDTSGYTYGYCNSSDYRYYTTGWRIAYIKDSKVVLVSAGAPECVSRTISTANVTFINTANALALKYCNTDYVDSSCNCTGSSGQCSSASTDAWAINDYDFYYMTQAITKTPNNNEGYGKRLTENSSGKIANLGQNEGGTLNQTFCYNVYGYKECGYHHDLIDNGGNYWFADSFSSDDTAGVYWDGQFRSVEKTTSTSSFGLRLGIKLSSTVYVTGGAGTMEDPYTIGN